MSLPNTIGSSFAFTCFGESHGRCIGVVVDGCPTGLELSEADIQTKLDLRKPGQSIVTTQRGEADKVEILSGVFKGRTTGAPICMIIWNSDVRSSDYEKFVTIPRPGHADYPAFVKYAAMNDYRGGGRFSGRITAGFVMAGAIAEKLLLASFPDLQIYAYTIELGGIRADLSNLSSDEIIRRRYLNEVRCPDGESAQRMKDLIMEERGRGDSLGGIVECNVTQLPIGLGEPVFSSIESEISKSIFSIPAVKGIEFGSGFSGARLKGSENNDSYLISKNGEVVTRSNNSGGILGGLSTGMPLVFRTAFKPASSIARPQDSVDLATRKESKLIVPGRHDPSVVPRAVPVIESMTACVVADLALRGGYVARILKNKK